jgi:hydroxymethylglutaryl-CoA reductase
VLSALLSGLLKDHELEKKLRPDYTRYPLLSPSLSKPSFSHFSAHPPVLRSCRAVRLRRALLEHRLSSLQPSGPSTGLLSGLPYQHYDYDKIFGANCEIVIGYMPVPVGTPTTPPQTPPLPSHLLTPLSRLFDNQVWWAP